VAATSPYVVDEIDVVVRDGADVELATIRFGWATRVARTPTLHAVLDTIAELVGLTLARTGRYDQEHELITELQTALLPPAPDVDGLEVAVRYAPASAAVGIGGDWYDLVTTPDGGCVAVIGDVSGHGPAAVTMMAQLKAVMAQLISGRTSPDEVFSYADAMMIRQESQATAQLARIDRHRSRVWITTAGHPAAMLRRADGRVEQLAGDRRPLLGVRWRRIAGGPVDEPAGPGAGPSTDPETDHETDHDWPADGSAEFHPGDVLVMYTDGLVERRRTSIDAQLQRLADALAAMPVDVGLGEAIDTVIETMLSDGSGDVAIDDDRAVIAIRRR
jgi:serine phosphatase RsbU (regulator of sigma subunit)